MNPSAAPAPAPAPASGRSRWLPGLQLLRGYPSSWWRHDIAAGLVLTTMLVPVGIAYAVASGVPGIHGLYATIACLLAYALFGPSRILVLGPDSSLAALILAVVLPLSAGSPQRAVALAGAMALAVGLLCIAAGLARLGFVTELLSKPIRYGYMNGIALAVIVSQCPKLFDMKTQGERPPAQLLAFAAGLLDGRANAAAAAIGVAALVLILLLKRWPRLPAMLLAITLATVVVGAFGLDGSAGVAVLGAVPQGLPAPAWPWIGMADLLPVLSGALAVALVAFADTSVLSRTYAQRTHQIVDADQELFALGAANLACGLFQGFAVNSSSSRTPVAEAAGARSQMTGVVSALAVAVLLLAAPALLQYLPGSALAAVVIASVIGLIEWRDLQRIRRIQPWEFWLAMACTAGVLALGAIQGIVLAVVIAVIEFLWDGWRPHWAVLGKVDGIDGWHDVARHPEAERIDGLVLLRWDAPLFFANAEWFDRVARGVVARAPTPAQWLVVTAEPVTSVDVTAADMLRELDQWLAGQGVELCFAEMKGPVKDKLKRFGLFGHFGQRTFFATIDDAVRAYRAAPPGQAGAR
ncbi:MAG TPA: SulP family inorganic anion transporter [Rubrivivax sp.]|nr:SulP family inorganic anion transporter [Rubrivivax sp.]HPO18875.1 SulP family inorganic anion transporter [Rubrivivax sp.]